MTCICIAVTMMLTYILSRSIHVHSFLSPQTATIGIRRTTTATFLSSSNNLITSTKSNTVKNIKALLTKRKKRLQLSQVVVEGPRMVFDLLRNPETHSLVQQIVVDESRWDDYHPQLASALLAQSASVATAVPNRHDCLVVSATSEVLDACTDTLTNQGILAIVTMPLPFSPDDDNNNNNNNNNNNTSSIYLIADAVSDPGNLGTLLRSARAVGVTAVYLLPGTCDPWNPKAVRSAMGTTFSLPLRRVDSWHNCWRELQHPSLGCQTVYAAALLDHVHSVQYDQVDWTAKGEENSSSSCCALVIGSEGNGLTPPVQESVLKGRAGNLKVQAIHVPMQEAVESLNAGVCGSVILFEYMRQQQRHVKLS